MAEANPLNEGQVDIANIVSNTGDINEDKDLELEQHNEVKLIIYDFDQTITKLHLYRELHGGKLTALSKVSDKTLISIFGGEQRITDLDAHFKFLTNQQIEIAIISFGWKEVIKQSLNRLNLGIYFKNNAIFGRDSKEIIIVNKNKGKVVKLLMQQRNLTYNQVLFVDDSLGNIKQASNICKTLYIKTRCGINNDDMDKIEKQIYVYSEDELKEILNTNNKGEEKENKENEDDKNGKHIKRVSSLAKYKIKTVPKWFADLNKVDDETAVIEIKENSDDKQEVKIAPTFTFENINNND